MRMNSVVENKSCRKKAEERKRENKIFVIAMFVFTVFIPPMLAVIIFNCDCLSCIPGDSQIWFSFWASYSGALATIVVAFFSYKSGKQLEEVNESFRQRENDYISTLIGVNFRLQKVYIIPQRAEKDDENKAYSKYLMRFLFKNVSYTVMQTMEINEITIENKNYTIKDGGCFFLEGETPALEVVIPVQKGSEEEKRISQFYFYYSQFGRNKNSLNVVIKTHIVMGWDNDEKPKNKEIQIKMKLKMEPEVEEDSFSNKVKIVHYEILPIDTETSNMNV